MDNYRTRTFKITQIMLSQLCISCSYRSPSLCGSWTVNMTSYNERRRNQQSFIPTGIQSSNSPQPPFVCHAHTFAWWADEIYQPFISTISTIKVQPL